VITIFLSAAALWATPATASPIDAFLMRAWYAQNEICRGDWRPEACAAREDTERMLRREGWTYDGKWKRVRVR
jgi:hypothetical protein